MAGRLSRAGFFILGALTLPAEGFGRVALGLSFVAVTTLGLQGVSRTRRRYRRIYRRAGDPERLRGLRRASVRAAALGTAAATAALMAFAWRTSAARGAASSAAAALALLAALPPLAFVREAMLAKRTGGRRLGRLSAALEPLAQLAFAGVALALARPSPFWFAAAYGAGFVVSSALSLAPRGRPGGPSRGAGADADAGAGTGERKRPRRPVPATARPRAVTATYEAREWAGFAAASSVDVVSTQLVMHAADLGAGGLVGAWAAGLLRLAHHVVEVFALLPRAVALMTLLHRGGGRKQGRPAAVLARCRRARRRSVLLGGPFLGLAILLSGSVAAALAPSRPALAPAIAVLAGGVLVSLALGSVEPVLRAIGSQRAVRAILLAHVGDVVAKVLGTVLLASSAGLTGAAVALALGLVVRQTLLQLLARAVFRQSHAGLVGSTSRRLPPSGPSALTRAAGHAIAPPSMPLDPQLRPLPASSAAFGAAAGAAPVPGSGLFVSAIICSRNPRPDYLARVLAALEAQTLPRERWELLLIDKASDQPLRERFAATWHLNARPMRAEPAGKVHALVQGIAAARGDVLVVVDDDNVLDPTYLERVADIFARHPFIGVANGIVRGEFEVEPPRWVGRYGAMLALRDRGPRPLYSLMPGFTGIACWGAGMALRREVALHYAREVERDPRRTFFARQGGSLAGCEDGDMALCAFDIGLAQSYFPELGLSHLIPPERTAPDYFLRLVHDNFFAGFVLQLFRGNLRPARALRRQWFVREIYALGEGVLKIARRRWGFMDYRLSRRKVAAWRDAHLEYRRRFGAGRAGAADAPPSVSFPAGIGGAGAGADGSPR